VVLRDESPRGSGQPDQADSFGGSDGGYEAHNLGVPHIGTEHLLLGVLREDKALIRQVLLNVDYDSAHRDIAARVKPPKSKTSMSVDLPLAEDAKLALKHSMEEADRLNSRHIGTEHLLIGLLHEKEFPSAKLLSQFGATLESLRKRVETLPQRVPFPEYIRQFRRAPVPPPSTLEIHGKKFNVEAVREAVSRLKEQPWYWERKQWQSRDVVFERDGKRFSFDTTLAKDSSKFVLVKAGWKKDYCAICRGELFESDDANHGVGFTNGKDWVCTDCHQRFIAGDFFSSAYSDIT
jgi:hypothetical protein